MEFNEHEEDVGIQMQESYKRGGGYRYKECLKNHAVGIGGQAVDGCGEFIAAGDEGTLDGLKCAACNCHRNFHRKQLEDSVQHYQKFQHKNALQQHQYITATPYYHHQHRPTGYLIPAPAPALALGPGPGSGPGPVYSPFHHRPLALPSTSRDDLDEISNPSSSGGVGVSGSKKRFRTKFTTDQKDRMLAFSEALGWRIQKQDEPAVQRFCEETGVKRNVLKVWMHNNKHTIGKKP